LGVEGREEDSRLVRAKEGGPPGVWIRLGRAGQKRGSSDFICLDLGEVGPGYLARSWSRSRTLPKPQLA
jgi:hypothetical protein